MTEQLNFTLSSWRKICLSSFGGRNLIFFSVPEKNGLSQASSRRHYGSRRIMHGGSRSQGCQSVHRYPLQTQGGGCEVVQQLNVFQIQLPCKRRDVHNPRQVFRVMPPGRNHTCHPEPSGINCRPIRLLIRCCRLLEEIFDQIFKSRIVPRRETALEDGTKGWPFLHEQPKIAFCASNVPGQNHCRLAP